MSINFRPDGQLDIATDPAALPQQVQNGTVISNALTRCKNLRINQSGQVTTRDGSVKLNATALGTIVEIVQPEIDREFNTNQGFSSLDGWIDSSTGSEAADIDNLVSPGPAVGRLFLRISIGDGHCIADKNINTIFVTPGVEHTLTFTANAVDDLNQYVQIGTTQGNNDLAEFKANVLGAQNVSLSFIPTQSTFWLRFANRSPTTTVDFIIDNVSIKQTGEVKPNLLIEQENDFYTFAGSSIHRNNSTIVNSALTDAQWSGFKYNSFNSLIKQIFALNGTDRKRVFGNSVVEWGIDAPTVKATLAVGSSTGLTGDYLVKYTYVRKESTVIVSESNPSPASSSQTLSNESLSVTVIASTDAEVTHIRVYRTVAGGGVYLVDQDITVPAVTLDSTTTDANLGVEVETDHNRPPATGTVAFGPLFNGISFIIDGPNLHYCIAKKVEYWPTNHFVEVSNLQFPGIAGVLWNGQPYVLTNNDIFFIQGSSHGSFFPLKMQAKTGAQGIFGAVAVQGQGIFHTGVDGIYLFANGRDNKITEPRLEPIFRKARTGEDTTIGTLPRVGRMDNAILHQFLNLLFFAYSSTATGNPDNVVVLNLDTQRITHHVYNDGSDIKITAMHTDITNQRLLVADDTGFVRHIEKNDTADDSGTAIPFDVQSMDFTLQTRKHFPRWAKYDVDASASGASVTGELNLDGVLHQSHTITGNRQTRRRLVETGNGNRQSHRIHGSGQVTIFAVESE